MKTIYAVSYPTLLHLFNKGYNQDEVQTILSTSFAAKSAILITGMPLTTEMAVALVEKERWSWIQLDDSVRGFKLIEDLPLEPGQAPPGTHIKRPFRITDRVEISVGFKTKFPMTTEQINSALEEYLEEAGFDFQDLVDREKEWKAKNQP